MGCPLGVSVGVKADQVYGTNSTRIGGNTLVDIAYDTAPSDLQAVHFGVVFLSSTAAKELIEASKLP